MPPKTYFTQATRRRPAQVPMCRIPHTVRVCKWVYEIGLYILARSLNASSFSRVTLLMIRMALMSVSPLRFTERLALGLFTRCLGTRFTPYTTMIPQGGE